MIDVHLTASAVKWLDDDDWGGSIHCHRPAGLEQGYRR